MLSDLYTGTDSQTRDFRTVVWRMKALGFNAIRVAFNFDTLDKPTGDKPYRMACRDAGAAALYGSVTPPGGAGPTGGGAPPSVANGVCNDGIPDDSVYRRFLWAVDYIASQNMCGVFPPRRSARRARRPSAPNPAPAPFPGTSSSTGTTPAKRTRWATPALSRPTSSSAAGRRSSKT